MNLVTLTQPQSAAAEAYRTLRTNLHFATLESPVKTVVVAAPSRDDGKSAALANLAVVMSQADKRVIVVDADLRQPSLHDVFGAGPGAGAGFADMLADEAALRAPPLRDTRVPGVRLVVAGTPSANPSDLLSSPRVKLALAELGALADIVLIDVPPLTQVSDGALLASQCDGVLLVLSAGKTRREHARAAKELIERARATLLGAVMLNAPKGDLTL